MKKFLKRVVATITILATAFAIYAFVIGNFHQLDSNAYRSAQLFSYNMPYYLKKYHIKTVINLRGHDPAKKWYQVEANITKQLGVELINFKMRSTKYLDINRSKKLIAIMQNAKKPILIHCQGGADRTSLASALYIYGVKANYKLNSRINICWEKAEKEFEFNKILNEVKIFNNESTQYKMGVAVMPITFGISFTSSFLNQASSLVHVYTDGTVGVSTAAIEMGQGVNEKIKVAVSKIFSINPDRIILESTNTTRVANTSPTAASTGADLNGNAAVIASSNILERLKTKAAEIFGTTAADIEIIDEVVFAKGNKTKLNWEELVWKSYFDRISLSSQAYYASPNIYFDRDKNQGRPFVYYVYGTAIVVAKVDGLRGTYEITDVKVVHDFGNSLHTQIDLGQAEGAIVQGIGWVTLEELVQNKEGRLLSNTFSTYKIPDIYSTPKNIEVMFLENSENPYGPFNSKAIGEPPFMYGIGAYFAIRNAIKEFVNVSEIPFSSPLTYEKVLLALNNFAE
jgi:xanthine dehydrogenase large subunit